MCVSFSQLIVQKLLVRLDIIKEGTLIFNQLLNSRSLKNNMREDIQYVTVYENLPFSLFLITHNGNIQKTKKKNTKRNFRT